MLFKVFIYIALGNVKAGIAVTLFFIYPIATTLGAWVLFGDRPSTLRFLAMGGITAGLILAVLLLRKKRAKSSRGASLCFLQVGMDARTRLAKV